MTTRKIEAGDENMGTTEAASWQVGDRVGYDDNVGGDGAFDRVRDLLGRRGLELVDDGAGWAVRASVAIGDRVEGGRPGTEDHDTGLVTGCDGDQVTVAWDSGVTTTQHGAGLRPESAE